MYFPKIIIPDFRFGKQDWAQYSAEFTVRVDIPRIYATLYLHCILGLFSAYHRLWFSFSAICQRKVGSLTYINVSDSTINFTSQFYCMSTQRIVCWRKLKLFDAGTWSSAPHIRTTGSSILCWDRKCGWGSVKNSSHSFASLEEKNGVILT